MRIRIRRLIVARLCVRVREVSFLRKIWFILLRSILRLQLGTFLMHGAIVPTLVPFVTTLLMLRRMLPRLEVLRLRASLKLDSFVKS
jgi:hypothetical protein